MYNLIVIGETCGVLKKKYLPNSIEVVDLFKENRNKITHMYWNTNSKKQWELLQEQVKELKKNLKNI